MILNKKTISNVNRMEEHVYRALRSHISYSDLKLLDSDREAFFKQKVLGEKVRDKPSASKTMGSMVHALLSGLEGAFDEKFTLSVHTPPTGQVLTLCENLIERSMRSLSENNEGEMVQQDSFEQIFTDALDITQYNYKREQVMFKGKSKEKVLEMFQETGQAYYEECMNNINRTVVSVAEIEKAEKLVKKTKENEFMQEYLQESSDNVDVYTEYPILYKLDGVNYRAMPDKYWIDHSKGEIKWLDWKTTWDAENGIIGSYLSKGYYLQGAKYTDAINAWKNQQGMKDYKIVPPTFVFIDTKGFNAPTKFKLTENDVDRGNRGFWYRGRRYKGLAEIKQDLSFHLETGIWDMDREIYKNRGYMVNPIRYGSV